MNHRFIQLFLILGCTASLSFARHPSQISSDLKEFQNLSKIEISARVQAAIIDFTTTTLREDGERILKITEGSIHNAFIRSIVVMRLLDDTLSEDDDYDRIDIMLSDERKVLQLNTRYFGLGEYAGKPCWKEFIDGFYNEAVKAYGKDRAWTLLRDLGLGVAGFALQAWSPDPASKAMMVKTLIQLAGMASLGWSLGKMTWNLAWGDCEKAGQIGFWITNDVAMVLGGGVIAKVLGLGSVSSEGALPFNENSPSNPSTSVPPPPKPPVTGNTPIKPSQPGVSTRQPELALAESSPRGGSHAQNLFESAAEMTPPVDLSIFEPSFESMPLRSPGSPQNSKGLLDILSLPNLETKKFAIESYHLRQALEALRIWEGQLSRESDFTRKDIGLLKSLLENPRTVSVSDYDLIRRMIQSIDHIPAKVTQALPSLIGQALSMAPTASTSSLWENLLKTLRVKAAEKNIWISDVDPRELKKAIEELQKRIEEDLARQNATHNLTKSLNEKILEILDKIRSGIKPTPEEEALLERALIQCNQERYSNAQRTIPVSTCKAIGKYFFFSIYGNSPDAIWNYIKDVLDADPSGRKILDYGDLFEDEIKIKADENEIMIQEFLPDHLAAQLSEDVFGFFYIHGKVERIDGRWVLKLHIYVRFIDPISGKEYRSQFLKGSKAVEKIIEYFEKVRGIEVRVVYDQYEKPEGGILSDMYTAFMKARGEGKTDLEAAAATWSAGIYRTFGFKPVKKLFEGKSPLTGKETIVIEFDR